MAKLMTLKDLEKINGIDAVTSLVTRIETIELKKLADGEFQFVEIRNLKQMLITHILYLQKELKKTTDIIHFRKAKQYWREIMPKENTIKVTVDGIEIFEKTLPDFDSLSSGVRHDLITHYIGSRQNELIGAIEIIKKIG